MKKLILFLCALTVIMSFCVVAHAETLGNDNWGVTFDVPEGFNLDYSEDDVTSGMVKFITEDNRACINFYYVKNPAAYFDGLITDEEFNMVLDAECATEYLGKMMSSGVVNFKSKNVYDNTINEKKYYFLDGEYVLRGEEVYEEDFSVTAVTWAKNGRVYIMSYIRFVNGGAFDVDKFLSEADFSKGEIKIYVNEERVYSDTPPAAIEGRTLVPIRAVAEAMGYTVDWDGEKQLVTLIPLNEDGNLVEFTINSSSYQVNGEEQKLDVEAMAICGRTYIPLRAAAEAMGAVVTWDATSNSAMIMY